MIVAYCVIAGILTVFSALLGFSKLGLFFSIIVCSFMSLFFVMILDTGKAMLIFPAGSLAILLSCRAIKMAYRKQSP